MSTFLKGNNNFGGEKSRLSFKLLSFNSVCNTNRCNSARTIRWIRKKMYNLVEYTIAKWKSLSRHEGE